MLPRFARYRFLEELRTLTPRGDRTLYVEQLSDGVRDWHHSNHQREVESPTRFRVFVLETSVLVYGALVFLCGRLLGKFVKLLRQSASARRAMATHDAVYPQADTLVFHLSAGCMEPSVLNGIVPRGLLRLHAEIALGDRDRALIPREQ